MLVKSISFGGDHSQIALSVLGGFVPSTTAHSVPGKGGCSGRTWGMNSALFLCFTSVSLSFLLYKMEKIAPRTSGYCKNEMKLDHAYQADSPEPDTQLSKWLQSPF